MKILITSGGTKIKIDMVRSITNMSKGTFGSKIAERFLMRNMKSSEEKLSVTFLHAKGSKLPFNGEDIYLNKTFNFCKFIEYETFDDYSDRLMEELKTHPWVKVGATHTVGHCVGFVEQVIKNIPKNPPDNWKPTMLHIELLHPDTTNVTALDWPLNTSKQSYLLDPTPYLKLSQY